MNANITVKTKFRVNGQDYASVHDMPPAIRQAYERAMASVQRGTPGKLVNLSGLATDTHVRSKITLNGQEFDRADVMPIAVRKLYDDVLATLDTEGRRPEGEVVQASGAPDGSLSVAEASVVMSAARPESTTGRLLIAVVVIAALLLVSLVLRR